MTVVVTVLFEAADRIPEDFEPTDHPLTSFISNPDFFSFFVAYVAGIAGVLSLTSAKSGALVGVLISVTTIPAAANVGVAGALGEWGEAGGAALQLGRQPRGDRAGRGDSRSSCSGAGTWGGASSTCTTRRDGRGPSARAQRARRPDTRSPPPELIDRYRATDQRRSDLDPHARDHLVGELAGGGVPAQVGRADARGDGLQHALVDRARGGLGRLVSTAA